MAEVVLVELPVVEALVERVADAEVLLLVGVVVAVVVVVVLALVVELFLDDVVDTEE
jgi:hypothetical protein